MLILAAEQSTSQSSAVITDDTEVLACVTWEESRIRSQQFFPKIEALVSRAGVSLPEIDLFAAGIGPGAFNALRMCISALNALALPDRKPVYAVSSAQALALQLRQAAGKPSISVVGDARRGYLWVSNSFFDDNSILPRNTELTIVKPADLATAAAGADVIASPDFQRITEVLASLPDSTARLRQGTVSPDARFVAETAFAAYSAGIESPPMQPTYIHPPV